jgi:uncharacterized cupin superfamily protein
LWQAAAVVREASLQETEHGLVPEGEGWFVVNAREARWRDDGPLGKVCFFEGDVRFDGLGINVGVLEPGQPMAMYHYEHDQEDFLVVAGEALLIVEGQERPLRPWDLVHCPRGTRHVIVGAGEGPCVLVSVGSRSAGEDWGAYTVDEAALRHGAGVEQETTKGAEAYARFPGGRFTRADPEWLPELSPQAGSCGCRRHSGSEPLTPLQAVSSPFTRGLRFVARSHYLCSTSDFPCSCGC